MYKQNIEWNQLKSERLKKTRGVSFEEILQEKLIGDVKHHARGNQHVFLFERSGYIWVVPYVKEGDRVFLKTLFPSRKYTKTFKEKIK